MRRVWGPHSRLLVISVFTRHARRSPAPASASQTRRARQPAPNPPPGFATDGFANAQNHYAGSDGTPSAANGSDHAVSQYDIACFGGPR